MKGTFSVKKFTAAFLTAMMMFTTIMPASNVMAAENDRPHKQPLEMNCDSGDESGAVIDSGYHISIENDISVEKTQKNDTINRRSASQKLDKVYDPREKSWYKNNIKIKNQGHTGMCWAFAATTAAEIYNAKYSEAASGTELSPIHLAYFMYNRVNDPLNNTANDKNIAEKADYAGNGGNNFFTFQAMANWIGLAAESKAPFIDFRCPSRLKSSLAYDNTSVIKDAKFLTSESAIKNAVYTNGSAICDIHIGIKPETYTASNGAYYTGGNKSPDHIVTVIGWDDGYSKENFNKKIRPDRDGAWIVQNSWGKSAGDNGYFYVSYEEKSMHQDALTFSMQDETTYDFNYQYDGSVNVSRVKFNKGEKLANVFKVPENNSNKDKHMLEAVGFTSYDKSAARYKISVFTDVRNRNKPEGGNKEYEAEHIIDATGFHTIELGKSIYLAPGTNYAVVLEPLSDSIIMGMEMEAHNDWITFKCGLGKGQSYWRSKNAKWYDLYDDGLCARIKGFASVVKEPVPVKEMSLSDVTLEYGKSVIMRPDISPENATERDISWSSDNESVAVVSSDGTVKAVGIGSATVNAAINYGNDVIKASAEVKVTKAQLKPASVVLKSSKYTYSGSRIKPAVTVKVNGKILKQGTDYKLSISNNINIGQALIKVSGIGMYSGSVTKKFVITPNAPASISCKLYDRYNNVLLKWSKVKGADGYYIYYKRSGIKTWKYVGALTSTACRVDELAAGSVHYFKVVPYVYVNGVKYKGLKSATAKVYTLKKIAAPSVTKYSGSKVKVKWNNISGETGYQISRSTKKKGTNIVLTYKTSSGNSSVIKSKKNKTYYYKVRAYKVSGGKKIYGPWSYAKKYSLK